MHANLLRDAKRGWMTRLLTAGFVVGVATFAHAQYPSYGYWGQGGYAAPLGAYGYGSSYNAPSYYYFYPGYAGYQTYYSYGNGVYGAGYGAYGSNLYGGGGSSNSYGGYGNGGYGGGGYGFSADYGFGGGGAGFGAGAFGSR